MALVDLEFKYISIYNIDKLKIFKNYYHYYHNFKILKKYI